MSTPEFHSFVHKFYQLWNSGYSAHLGIHCYAGEAWVDLHANLGRPHQHDQGLHHPSKRVSPSRYRRRVRRAAARDERVQESIIIEENTAEQVVEGTGIKEAEENITDKVVKSEAVTEEAVEAFNMANESKQKNVNRNRSIDRDTEKVPDYSLDNSDEKNVDKVRSKNCSSARSNEGNFSYDHPPLSKLSADTSEDENKNIQLEEQKEGFIGPRLPRMLTDEEVKAIFDRLLGDKYK